MRLVRPAWTEAYDQACDLDIYLTFMATQLTNAKFYVCNDSWCINIAVYSLKPLFQAHATDLDLTLVYS